MTKNSVKRFQFKNIVLKINYTESKMSDRKNLSLAETQPLAEAVLMKKIRRNKDKKECRENAWEKLSRN